MTNSATSAGRSIRVLSRHPHEVFDPARVFFAFASGRLTYDCIACGAKCCRGFGYGTATRTELQMQLTKRPYLRFFVHTSPESPESSHIGNCPPACFFLAKDGRCQIQREDGYESKPETCRLFPFNDLRTVGDYLIVSPHSSLCPLRVVPAESFDSRSGHEALLETMSARGISNDVARADFVHPDVEAVIRLERAIVSLSEQTLGRDNFYRFTVRQIHAYRDLLRPRSTPASEDRTLDDVTRFMGLCSQILECAAPSPEAPGDDIDSLMIALTPYLRRRLIVRDRVNGRAPASFDMTLRRVPHYLLASHLMVVLSRRAGMDDITFQTVTKLQEACHGLITLLSYADRVMVWRPGAGIDVTAAKGDHARPFIRLAKALLPSKQASRPVLFGDLLLANSPFNGIERLAFLRFVARHMIGRLVTIDALTARTRKTRISFRHRIQRWGLQMLSENTIHAACSRYGT
jgi:Fe-S-cluster containining protein